MPPRKGQRGIYRSPAEGEIGFTVVSVEGNLCWANYDNEQGNSQPFIWLFHDGLNTLHAWPGKGTA
jgi:hypothetical protein